MCGLCTARATSLFPERTVLRLSVPMMWSARLEMGCMALVLMLIAEFGFVLWIRGLSIKEYFATRDPVSGTAYYTTELRALMRISWTALRS